MPRPKKPVELVKSERFILALGKEEKELINKASLLTGKSKASVVRDALKEVYKDLYQEIIEEKLSRGL